MWRLCHRLFGWDYVRIEFGGQPMVVRVRYAPNGWPYVAPYGVLWMLSVDGLKFGDRPYHALTWADVPPWGRHEKRMEEVGLR